MTDNTLYDRLADDVIEGAAKNRKRAMILLEECKIREKKNRKVYNYCKIAPKTWALKKKESSHKDEVKPQQNDDRPKHPSRCCRNNARILELWRDGEAVRRFPSVPKAAKELGIPKNTIYDRCKDHFCIPDDNGYIWRLVYMDRPQLHRMTDEERSKYKIDSYEPMF